MEQNGPSGQRCAAGLDHRWNFLRLCVCCVALSMMFVPGGDTSIPGRSLKKAVDRQTAQRKKSFYRPTDRPTGTRRSSAI